MNQITYEQRVEVYLEALRQYGRYMQMVVALEELSEIQKEICKNLRGKENLDHMAEEIADATIMLEQIRMMYYGMNGMVCQKMDEKIRRLAGNLKMEIPDEKGMEAENTTTSGLKSTVTSRLYWKPVNENDPNNDRWTLTCKACGASKNQAEDNEYCPNCGVKFDGPPEELDE